MPLDELFQMAGKTALVTGGSRGLGQAVAEGFVRAGAKVYISSRKAEVCDRLAADLCQHGDCVSLPADPSRRRGGRPGRRAGRAQEQARHTGEQRGR